MTPSDFYGPHVTNRLIREALHPYPDGLVIVTKVGAVRGADASWNPALTAAELEPPRCTTTCATSASMCSTSSICASAAWHGPVRMSIEAPFAVLADLQRQGLIRHLGLSNVTAEQIRAGQGIAPVVCVQNHYNLAHRDDDALIDALADEDIAYVPFFPLGGFAPLQSSILSNVADALPRNADAGCA